MSLLNVIELSYQAGTKKLFEGFSLSIEPGDRIGLVGHNGCGKSTLLALLVGELAPDSGQVQVQRGLNIGRVEQFLPDSLAQTTMHDAVLQCIPIEDQQVRGYQVDTLLQELGFQEAQTQQSMASLSGGQKNLVLVARALIREPELLLLDEPGNHMDVAAMAMLKAYLQSPNTPAFLMISHDRDLLDSVTQRTVWIRDERAYSFQLPYSESRDALQALDEAAEKQRAAEEKEIDKLKTSAKRLATWGKVYDNEDLARKAKSMEKRIDKLEAQKTFVSQGSGLSLKVDAELLRAKQVFTLERETVKAPDNRPLFEVEELVFRPGDRIALLGVNGSGKSSCIKHLLATHARECGEQTSTRFNPNVRIGYFDQELEAFEGSEGIFDWVTKHCSAQEEEVKQSLIQWGFAYKDHGRAVHKLSGGERARLLLLTFQLDQPNLLIMDEPTNHIDLQGKEALEEDLVTDGLSLLFTSHDKQFLQRIATRYWWIHEGRLVETHSLDTFYESLGPRTYLDEPVPSSQVSTELNSELTSEEEILGRICELETLIAEDQNRKPKFQKPQRQQAWQAELEALMEKLS